ncbi:16146_t:CDS:1, partial [Gigaspora rosea]
LYYLYNEGLVERIHGNTGCVAISESRVFFDSSIIFSVKNFLKQYAIIYRLLSLMRYKNESEHFIYLPTEKTYTSVYNKFKEHFYIEHSVTENIISYFTFRRLWYEMMPYLKFQLPVSDLCEVCEILKVKLIIAKSNIDEYEQVKSQYNQHHKAVKKERQY